MNQHVGTIGKRVTARVTYVHSYTYETCFTYYGETHYIHKFVDAEQNVIVWKTGKPLGIDFVDAQGFGAFNRLTEGAVIDLTGSVKEHSEYKDEMQTVFQRCKFVLVEDGIDPEELRRQKKAEKDAKVREQLDTLTDGDFVWYMPYKQYKEHYADCETVLYSFDRKDGKATIGVIIRYGRLKVSGVRGMHYACYQFSDNNGKKITYRAINEENARKRLVKDYPGSIGWECTHIFNYRTY